MEIAGSTPWKLKSHGGKEENFLTVFPEIFLSSQEISFICKQESAREGELSEDRFMTPRQS
jgi:hypothetical protein